MGEVTFEEEDEDGKEVMPTDVMLANTDWTTETVISAIKRGTIQLTPRFQRRDAWDIKRKSRFIESLILGLPIPQVVLAESTKDRSKFIVLDGKQRLLSLLQFVGDSEGPNNGFALSNLELEDDLSGCTYEDLESRRDLKRAHNALLNQTIRTMVIRGWKKVSFLHTVFLRLNTGSLPLSSQELRQAAFPGPYTDALDDFSIDSKPLQKFLGLNGADYRMRDAELVARFVAFSLFLEDYPGRMKRFLDTSFEKLNAGWKTQRREVASLFKTFISALEALEDVFGRGSVARKENSRQLNKALFDALIYFFQMPDFQSLTVKQKKGIKVGIDKLLSEKEFLDSIERATADVPNTFRRLTSVGDVLRRATDFDLPKLTLSTTHNGQRISVAY